MRCRSRGKDTKQVSVCRQRQRVLAVQFDGLERQLDCRRGVLRLIGGPPLADEDAVQRAAQATASRNWILSIACSGSRALQKGVQFQAMDGVKRPSVKS